MGDVNEPSQRVFNPALIIVDVQEDFCPPDGTLAVAGGRDVAPVINRLLDYPFAVKVATRDYHPRNHVSFASSNSPPHNVPFESRVTIRSSVDANLSKDVPVWPAHCVQGTKGADLIPEIHSSKLDCTVEKGMKPDLEMFSAFADVFGNKSPEAASLELAALLRSKSITHVFAVGIAGDYCVKCTALDAQKEGFQVCVVEEAVRSVDPGDEGWGAAREEMQKAGIKIVSADSDEVQAVMKVG